MVIHIQLTRAQATEDPMGNFSDIDVSRMHVVDKNIANF